MLRDDRDEAVDGSGQSAPRARRRAVAPWLQCVAHLQKACVDGVVLVFHDTGERPAFLGAAFPQPRPDMPVFSHVVLTQYAAHQCDVVGDKPGALLVTRRDRANQVRHQPKLAAEHRVPREHISWVSERAAERRYRCHFMRPSTDAIQMLLFETQAEGIADFSVRRDVALRAGAC